MKIYYNLTESREIASISTIYTEKTPFSAEFFNAIFPDKLEGYLIENGEMKYSEELYEQKQKAKETAEAVKKAEDNIEYLKNKQFLDSLGDSDALTVAVLYQHWNGNGVFYKTGQRLQYESTLYKTLKDHVSQETWNPKDASSLFAKVLVEDPDKITEWEQPESTNGYSKGNKVTHNSKVWESLIDDNVFEPSEDAYSAWKEVTE